MRYAIPVFAQGNHRYGDLGGFAKEGLKRRFALGQGRKSVGVQNHRRSSGSICSNSRSIRRLILAVSLRKCRSLPKAAIQGLPRPFSAWSFSTTASETKAQKGIPRSAARDLARRKMPSGISRVVFMPLLSHIYGRGSRKSLLPGVRRGSEEVFGFETNSSAAVSHHSATSCGVSGDARTTRWHSTGREFEVRKSADGRLLDMVESLVFSCVRSASWRPSRS